MAANPKWCLSLSEWKKHLRKWILESTPESILEVNMFFDVRCAYGDETLVADLRTYIQDLSRKKPEFFIHYAKNSLAYKAPVGLRGHIRAERHGKSKTINLKDCLKPLETFARIYALKHGITQPGTLERLDRLAAAGVIQENTRKEITYVFEYLWQLRFYNQIAATAELAANSDELDLRNLTDVERDNLQAVLSRIPSFQSRLSYDFLGMQI